MKNRIITFIKIIGLIASELDGFWVGFTGVEQSPTFEVSNFKISLFSFTQNVVNCSATEYTKCMSSLSLQPSVSDHMNSILFFGCRFPPIFLCVM